MDSGQTTNQTLVEILRQRGDLENWRLADAFSAVPRRIFLPGATLEDVYADKSVPIRIEPDGEAICSETMPSMVAHLLDQIDLADGQNILHIGTGTGYSPALIGHAIGSEGRVTTLEIDRDMAALAQANLNRAQIYNVKVVNVDGAEGYAPRATYDRIVSGVGIWDIPAAWLRQLKPNGLIVAPISLDGLQVTAAFRPQPDGSLLGEDPMTSAFVYIRGIAAGPNIRKRIGSTAMTLIADDVRMVDPAALHLLLSADHEETHLSGALNTSDYWYGFLPYLMMNEPDRDVFALYHVPDGQKAYGISGEGFAFFTPASACFVPYFGLGTVHSFAGADAFLQVEDCLKNWRDAGRPGIDRLKLRFIPKAQGEPKITTGKLYDRRNQYLHIWLDES